MKKHFALIATAAISLFSVGVSAQSKPASQNLYIDVHHLGAGKVTLADVEKAHAKDLAVEKKYNVDFIKFWIDEKRGDVYCLSSAPDTMAIRKTHGEAHGLLPDQTWQVKPGMEAAIIPGKTFFIDVHELGAGKVTAKDVAAAHQKDLAVEQKRGVNFINYWVDEKKGRVVCLSQAPDTTAVIETHREAHGLLPAYIMEVKQGQ